MAKRTYTFVVMNEWATVMLTKLAWDEARSTYDEYKPIEGETVLVLDGGPDDRIIREKHGE